MATKQPRPEHEERDNAGVASKRRSRLRGYLVAAVLTVATVIAVEVAILNGGGGERGAGQTFESTGGGHVHGLGVNPADGAVFVASHNGLFRAARGETQARPVGSSGKDVMGLLDHRAQPVPRLGSPGRLREPAVEPGSDRLERRGAHLSARLPARRGRLPRPAGRRHARLRLRQLDRALSRESRRGPQLEGAAPARRLDRPGRRRTESRPPPLTRGSPAPATADAAGGGSVSRSPSSRGLRLSACSFSIRRVELRSARTAGGASVRRAMSPASPSP